MSALTGSGALAVVTGGGHTVQSANLNGTAVAAKTGTERGSGTKSTRQRTKVRTSFLYQLHIQLVVLNI